MGKLSSLDANDTGIMGQNITVLTAEIQTLKKQFATSTFNFAFEIGRRLTDAKAVLAHGQWSQWLDQEVNFSQSTANKYMQLYDTYARTSRPELLEGLSYTSALNLLPLPENQREKFLEEHNVSGMSTRAVSEAIKEKQVAEAACEEAKAAKRAEADAKQRLNEAEARKRQLQQELDDLKCQPLGVVLEDSIAVKNAHSEGMSKGQELADIEYKEKIADLEKELAQLRGNTTIDLTNYQAHCENMKNDFRQMMSALSVIKKSEPESANNLIEGTLNLLSIWIDKLAVQKVSSL